MAIRNAIGVSMRRFLQIKHLGIKRCKVVRLAGFSTVLGDYKGITFDDFL